MRWFSILLAFSRVSSKKRYFLLHAWHFYNVTALRKFISITPEKNKFFNAVLMVPYLIKILILRSKMKKNNNPPICTDLIFFNKFWTNLAVKFLKTFRKQIIIFITATITDVDLAKTWKQTASRLSNKKISSTDLRPDLLTYTLQKYSPILITHISKQTIPYIS